MHSNLERQHIATQMGTPRLHRVVLYTFCARKFFLAQGFAKPARAPSRGVVFGMAPSRAVRSSALPRPRNAGRVLRRHAARERARLAGAA